MFDFKTMLAAGLQVLGTEIPAEAFDRLALYFSELKKWSAKINLISRSTSDEQIIENHFIDSLTILPHLFGTGIHLLDIGSGAGFPGLVCKAVYPDMALTLVEPRLKRVSFLQHIIRALALKEVAVFSCRVEDDKQLSSHIHFSHITGRAVTEIGPFLQMAERFAHPGTRLICMKGPKWREELDEASSVLHHSAYLPPQVVQCVLPFSKAERAVLLFQAKNT